MQDRGIKEILAGITWMGYYLINIVLMPPRLIIFSDLNPLSFDFKKKILLNYYRI